MNSQIDWQRPETAVAARAVSPMSAMWRTIRGYILWSYERGTLHYDIMVTLILLFVFVSPHFINFKDKPVERNPHPIPVVVIPDPQGGFIYQIPASAVKAKAESVANGWMDQIDTIPRRLLTGKLTVF